jgi:hypothetical protein
MLSDINTLEQAKPVAALAQALDQKGDMQSTLPVPATETTDNEKNVTPTNTLPPPPPELPILLTETPQTSVPEAVESIEATQPPIVIQSTPRPTRTSIPTFGAPFKLIEQETVCDSNLPDGLLQVLVYNTRRRPLAGIEIIATWESGTEQFFTGFKPEINEGYADFIMSPTITYTIQLARGSDIASGLVAPACQAANGEAFPGSIKLTFQQP